MLCCVLSCVVCSVPDVCAVPFLNMGILLSVMFFCFVPVVCFDDMWMDSGNKEGLEKC